MAQVSEAETFEYRLQKGFAQFVGTVVGGFIALMTAERSLFFPHTLHIFYLTDCANWYEFWVRSDLTGY